MAGFICQLPQTAILAVTIAKGELAR